MATQYDPISFDDLTPIEIPVKLAGVSYTLREASAGAASKWRNFLLRSTKLSKEGKPVSIEGLADSEILLVSLCLFRADTGKPVSTSTVATWPSKIVKVLFEKSKQISGLDEKPDEEDEDKEDTITAAATSDESSEDEGGNDDPPLPLPKRGKGMTSRTMWEDADTGS